MGYPMGWLGRPPISFRGDGRACFGVSAGPPHIRHPVRCARERALFGKARHCAINLSIAAARRRTLKRRVPPVSAAPLSGSRLRPLALPGDSYFARDEATLMRIVGSALDGGQTQTWV